MERDPIDTVMMGFCWLVIPTVCLTENSESRGIRRLGVALSLPLAFILLPIFVIPFLIVIIPTIFITLILEA